MAAKCFFFWNNQIVVQDNVLAKPDLCKLASKVTTDKKF